MKKKEPPMKKTNEILPASRALVYAVGIFGVQLFIGYVNTFQTEFYNKMYSGFDSNIFYASAVIIFIAKLISCIGDPIIGSLIDRSSDSKRGKIRPWILRSAFPIALLTTVIFIYIPFQSKAALYAYITVTTVLWNIAMSFADIPSQGMLSRLSPNSNERDRAAAFSNLAKSVALAVPGIFVTVIMLILNAVKGAGNYEDKTYYLITALVLLVLGTSCYLLIYFCNRETVKSVPSKTVSMGEMFHELKSNKMIRIVLMIFLLGFARTMPLAVCVQANGALIGKVTLLGITMDTTADATWLPGILGAVTGILGVAIVPLICKKWGEKKTYIVFGIANFIASTAFCVFYWLLPADSAIRSGTPALVLVMLTQFVSSFLLATNFYIPLVMTADIVDYQFWKTGQRKEGVNFAIMSMSIKLSNALAVAAGMLVIAVSGYTQVMYASGHIPVRTQNIVMFAYVGFAGIACLLSAFPMLSYKIDLKTKREMQEALNNEQLTMND